MLFPEQFTYYKMTDDSMAPQLPAGATLTIRKCETTDIDPRKIYLVEVNAIDRFIRNILIIDNKLALLPNNRQYPYKLYDLSENCIRVIGIVEKCYMDIK